MKLLILIASLLVGSLSFAADEKVVCREQSGKYTTVVVRTGKSLPVKSNEILDSRSEADIEIYGRDFLMPRTSEDGIVETEDVMYMFDSLDKKISLRIYMDEMDQSSITVNGKTTSLRCF